MKTELRAKLERVLQKFIDEDDYRNFYVYETMIEDMARAVSLVYDAAEKGQLFAEKQK
jgi:hypothetical protein